MPLQSYQLRKGSLSKVRKAMGGGLFLPSLLYYNISGGFVNAKM